MVALVNTRTGQSLHYCTLDEPEERYRCNDVLADADQPFGTWPTRVIACSLDVSLVVRWREMDEYAAAGRRNTDI